MDFSSLVWINYNYFSHCYGHNSCVAGTVHVIFADEEYAIVYECYGTVDENGFCSDHANVELLGRSSDTTLTPERREQVGWSQHSEFRNFIYCVDNIAFFKYSRTNTQNKTLQNTTWYYLVKMFYKIKIAAIARLASLRCVIHHCLDNSYAPVHSVIGLKSHLRTHPAWSCAPLHLLRRTTITSSSGYKLSLSSRLNSSTRLINLVICKLWEELDIFMTLNVLTETRYYWTTVN